MCNDVLFFYKKTHPNYLCVNLMKVKKLKY